jgi:NADH:ubiquinone oxidoreductase subunit E
LCRKKSEALADILEQSIRERNIDITLERIKCLGECGNGPSMRLAPGGKFFLKVNSDDIAGILVELEEICGKRRDQVIEASPQFWPGT